MKFRTYFSELASDHPHFIVAGHTDDRCCNDALQITSMEYELHRHLKSEGYDAVIFYNRTQKVYCYDYRSYRLFCNIHCEDTAPRAARAEHAEDDGFNLTGDGPLGLDPELDEEESPVQVAEGGALGNRSINPNAFWVQMSAMFRGDKKVALIMSNMNAMINDNEGGDFTVNALNTLVELGEHAGRNQSIAIYIFRGLEFASIEYQLRGQGDEWARFMDACLGPVLCRSTDISNKKVDNHVIRVDFPNAAEIRNLLMNMRSRENNALNISYSDVKNVALKLSYRCSAEDLTLNAIISKMDAYIAAHPNSPITPANCHEFIGAKNCNKALEDLSRFIGLGEVKEKMRGIYAMARQKGAKEISIPESSSRFTPKYSNIELGHDLNVCLMGEPGTGKSEIAMLLGRIYYEAGLLPTAHVESATPASILEGEIGGSGRNMASLVQRAMGGVLFIDEAYGLSESNARKAGGEAIAQLVNDMTAYKGKFAVVLAGYEKDLTSLINDNVGLQSRFLTANYYRLKPYEWQEIRDILLLMASKDNATFLLGEEFGQDWLDNFCENWVGDRGLRWGNAREAENLLSEMKQIYSARVEGEDVPRGEYRFTPADIPPALRVHLKPRSRGLDEALERMDSLIGLETAKRFLRNLCATIRWDGKASEPGNYLFIGPPGTGKTFFAEHMGEILNHLHVLRRRTPVIINAGDLARGIHGSVNDVVELARGGMLFIDEAHQLKDTNEGQRIIRDLVPLIENPEIRADTCFVLAGYQDEMIQLLSLDAGLESRFPCKNHISFVNYTPEQLTRILEKFAIERGYQPERGYLDRTQNALNQYLDNVDNHFGNARFMRSVYLEESIMRRTKRLNLTYIDDIPESEREYAIPAEATVKGTSRVNYLEVSDIPEFMDGFAGPIGMPLLPSRDSAARLRELVGKEKVKEYVEAYKKTAGVPEFFDSAGVNGMHFVITGSPGVGRHTVAKTLASMLYEMGKIKNERPISKSKGDFEGEYVGHTVPKTINVINGAKGNMLIIENPSSMLPKSSSDNTYGTEALSTIVGAMSSSDTSMVFIDTAEGIEAVIKSVNGLRDKAVFFELEDLTPGEMQEIFLRKTQNNICFDDETDSLLKSFFVNWVSDRGGLGEKTSAWANGSELEALIVQLKNNWSRLGGEKRVSDDIPRRVITKEMFPEELSKYLVNTQVDHKTALDDLLNMTGLEEVKRAIEKINRRLKRADKSCTIPGCYCFIGNPGTGKTTVARKMGGVLKAVGILEQGHVIERSAATFANNPDSFTEALKLAKNGILFIDEAHQLCMTAGGREVIRKLVTVLEDQNVLRVTAIILAGYPAEMAQLLNFDSGLNRRFGGESSIIRFMDYTPSELVEIMKDLADGAKNNPQIAAPCNLTLSDEYCDISLGIFKAVCAAKSPDFGNAGFVRNYLNDSVDCLLERLADMESIDYHLTAEDIPERFRALANATRLKASVVEAAVDTQPFSGQFTHKLMRNYAATVTVYLVVYKNGQRIGSGSGIIVTREGHILTCAHVVDKADSVRAKVYAPGSIGSDYLWFDCAILHPIAKDVDMALLKMEGCNFNAASIRPADEPLDESEQILLSGFPLGKMLSEDDDEKLRISHFFGGISSFQANNDERVFADITGLHGNSGGPVFSMDDGRVVGLFAGSIAPGEGSLDENNYFMPIRLFWERFTVDLSKEDK